MSPTGSSALVWQVRRLLAAAAAVLGLLLAVPAPSQSLDQLHAYQSFEEAKAARDWPAALIAGQRALALAEGSSEEDSPTFIDLLSSFAEVQVKSGQPQDAIATYERVLALQQKRLGGDHPHLIETLDALIALQLQAGNNAAAAALLQRELRIEQAVYGERSANALATLQQLRDVDVALQRPAEVTRIDALLAKLSTAERSFELPGAQADRARRYRQTSGGFATVRVFYGTNRAATGQLKPTEFYGKERGELQFGYADVSIPEVHREGELETQSRWSIYTYVMGEAALKRHYVLLNQVTPLAKDAFLNELRSQIKSAPSKDVFVFVHGFNTSFEDAALRTAQLAYDIDFDGTPIMYSWPSQGSATAYTVDEAAVGISGRLLATFLDDVIAQSGAERVHLIAHSMGNRALIEALDTYFGQHKPQKRPVFGQVVFTAPDVDHDYFADLLREVGPLATRATLYASDNDLALKSSEALHGAPRAGLAGKFIITQPGLDSIDMSAVKADLLGHGYFAADAGAIFDLFRLLWRGDPPPQRCGMTDRQNGAPTRFWSFNDANCKGYDLLEAGVLLKRFGDQARSQLQTRLAALTDPSQRRQLTQILAKLNDLIGPDKPAAVR